MGYDEEDEPPEDIPYNEFVRQHARIFHKPETTVRTQLYRMGVRASDSPQARRAKIRRWLRFQDGRQTRKGRNR